ncbi:arsenate reductase ArsC [Chitinimonas sp.]|uniref:arsenate reductase ArsC n=1 Tax=Chitinimonas sp. TaxID=1934313 RepID=UPI0035B2C7A1
MPKQQYNVLFLCTGNSARSIMAEAITNKLGNGRIRAFSAGSFPKGEVNPLTLHTLQQHGYPIDGLRSKGWEEFNGPQAPHMDFIFTVCDDAANEVCPVWPGHPMTAHWGFADPARSEGDEAHRQNAFNHSLIEISHRIRLFLSLPPDKIDHLALQQLHAEASR